MDSTAKVSPEMADQAMTRYSQGEAQAFGVIYDCLAPRLYGYLFRRTKNHAQTEDLVQQTFLQIHKARGRFVAGASVLPWAYSIAHHLLLDEIRKRGRQSRLTESYQHPEPETNSAEQLMQARQMSEALSKQLSQLPETQRAAFELVRWEGLSHAETAQVLGTTLSAVKSLIHRAYKTLRSALESEELGEAPVGT